MLISRPPQDVVQLYNGILIFGFSFLILMNVWHSYSRVMAVLPVETRVLLALNVVLLFVVAIEPYLLNVIAFPPNGTVQEAASVLYAFDIAAMNVILAGFMHILTQEERALLSRSEARMMRAVRNYVFGSGVFFAITAFPFFWEWQLLNEPSRVVLWTISLPVGWLIRILSRRMAFRPS